MRKHIFTFLPAFILFLTFLPLHAQDVASITGVISDQTGAVLPGTSVVLANAATGASYKAESNAVGSYTIANVAPGPGYSITFAHDGFLSQTLTGLYLNVASTRTQSVSLKVGANAQTVEISAESQNITLNTSDATVGNSFQVQFLNELPVANRDSPAALFIQQPGVTLDGAVTGARVDQNNVTVDGLDVNDMATGTFGTIVGNAPVDSVQEFRGVTAGPLASAGEGSGGQYDLVTRSGSNQLHGSLVEYHRDTDLEANNWFNNNSGVPRPPLIRNQFGGNIGGPIRHNKAFFFFDWNSRRDTLSDVVTRIVPMDAYKAGTVSYYTDYANGVTNSLTPQQVMTLDPQGIGNDSALLSLYASRYPAANDFSGACDNQPSIPICPDLVNTAGFRFNASFPYVENDYVSRLDYNLSDTMKVFARVTITRTTGTENAIQFPGDPQTFPSIDQSYGWVVGHTWTIGSNISNQIAYGETVENFGFPTIYNPTGITQYSFGGTGTGGNMLSYAYPDQVNAQNRTYPIPVVRDDFNWQRGKHSLAFGGTFKYINPSSNTVLNYNQPTLGLGGNIQALNSALRPPDLDSDSVATAYYDQAFALALGRYGNVSSTFNYDAKGNILPQGSGSSADFRYYETELYAGDTWKLTPQLTLSYGLRWQNYSVPYEKHGIESVPTLNFNQFFSARMAQSADGASGNTAVPFVSYLLGGKANNGPGYFTPGYANFAPRVAFAYNPSFDRKSVFNGGIGIIYDHTVVNAVQYQASQYSYLFQASANTSFGTTGDPVGSLTTDPRFSGVNNPPAPPVAPAAITAPYTPFVADSTPYGLANGQAFNETVDSNLKTPYSITYNLGFQHEFPQGFLLKATYVGRQGRRLLAQADANQLIDFPDTASSELMSTAFASIESQVRAGADSTHLPADPWFENQVSPALANLLYSAYNLQVANNTSAVATAFKTYIYRGDFADTVQALASGPFINPNVGMGSQFSEDTYYTNKGFSSYNGLLVTLHKNAGYGLQFDLNYTWSHSIDNVSLPASGVAFGGYGFICDVVRPRECRGNSDFDVTHYLNGNFIYELPVGRGKSFANQLPFWFNEVIGGWELSGLPNWHSGLAYFAGSNAYLAGFSNNAPAILTGPKSLLNVHLNGGKGAPLMAFSNASAAQNAYVGPLGFQIGGRNNLRGPHYFNMDMGLGKTFPIYLDKVNLKFRTDAFNVFNHPNFDNPNSDITSPVFGTISSTVSSTEVPIDRNASRVLQLSLRLEF